MSRAFLDRNNQSNSNSSDKNTSQQKVTYEAQMKRLEDNINNPGGKKTFSPLQMFAEEEEEKQAKARDEEELQMKPEEEELQAKEGPGDSGTKTDMPDDVQNKMENSFGVDFSDVDIHKDSPQAPSLGALAYTQGNDVHFAPGQYNPGSKEGQELLGHELAHVIQQREGRVKPTKQGKDMSVNTDPALEKEADEQGKQAAQGKMADVKGKGSGVQRQGREIEKTITKVEWLFLRGEARQEIYETANNLYQGLQDIGILFANAEESKRQNINILDVAGVILGLIPQTAPFKD
jgi:hypothetical protein